METLSTIAYSEQAGSQPTREQLIMEHLPQVRWIATRLHERLRNNTCLDDLISTGVIGLISAIDSFDPKFNVKLKTYAEHRIRGAILDSLRGLDGVAPHKRKRLKQIQAAMAGLEQKLQRAPLEEEIAAELKMSLKEYQEALLDLQGVTIGSLETVTSEGDSRNLLNFISDREEKSPARQLERAELEKLIQEGLEKMPKVERLVLDLYYRQEQNIREIAPILDLHITRISQIKTQGVLRLRNYVERRWPSQRGVF